MSRYGLHGRITAQPGRGDELTELLLEGRQPVSRQIAAASFSDRFETVPAGGKGLRSGS